MSHWKEHYDIILSQVNLWQEHSRAVGDPASTDVFVALNDIELALHEARKAEENRDTLGPGAPPSTDS